MIVGVSQLTQLVLDEASHRLYLREVGIRFETQLRTKYQIVAEVAPCS